ncbi:MAG: C4-dicarboxylate ABC transporter permease, partial [Pseudomonadota bacterium]
MEVAILFGMVILLLLIGVPIAVSLGLASITFLFMYAEDASLRSFALSLFVAFGGVLWLLGLG